MDDALTSKRRPLQFSLRTLLVAMLLASFGLGWLAMKMRQANRQREAAEAIARLGGLVFYDFEVDESGGVSLNAEPAAPRCLRALLGDDFFAGVEQVSLGNEGMEHIAALPTLRRLNVSYPITDADLVYLAPLTQLEELNLGATLVSDAGVEQLKRLPRLRRLDVWGTQITEQGVKTLVEAMPDCDVVSVLPGAERCGDAN